MRSHHGSPFREKDFLHLVVLVCIVPVVFYAAYYFLRQTASSNPEPDRIATTNSDAIYDRKPEDTPPEIPKPIPGTAWLEKIDGLNLKLIAFKPTTPEQTTRKAEIAKKMKLVRSHIEANMDEVPSESLSNSRLKTIIQNLANDIDQLQKSPESAVLSSLSEGFDAFERTRKEAIQKRLQSAFEEKSTPILNENRRVANEQSLTNGYLQNKIDIARKETEKIQRDTKAEFDKRNRARAYEEDRTEIQYLLSPFISPGYWQLEGEQRSWKMTAFKAPMSYSSLEKSGGLESDIRGVTILSRLGGDAREFENPGGRSVGTFPMYSEFTVNNPTNIERVKRAQELLKKHSVHMIETGILNQ